MIYLLIAIWIILTGLNAFWAKKKGHNFFLYLILSLFISPIFGVLVVSRLTYINIENKKDDSEITYKVKSRISNEYVKNCNVNDDENHVTVSYDECDEKQELKDYFNGKN